MKPRTSINSPLPFVSINAAISADGKIAPPDRRFVPFGSKRDEQNLYELRATADAVISGARTVDMSPVTMGAGDASFRKLRLSRGLSKYNLRVLVSGTGSLDPDAEVFKHRFSPIIILTTSRASKSSINRLATVADEVKVFGEDHVDLVSACRWLRQKWGVKRLICEGGGELYAAFLEADLVDELHLTICPVIIGGRQSPTLADGKGIDSLIDSRQFELKSQQRVGDELFLIYKTRK